MFRSYRIGRLLGFPVEVNVSFLILLGIALLFWGGITGVFFVLILFASVLLHELGHALVARHLGVPIAGIELHFFGGAAKMTALPRTANDEVLIAAAGPAVSFALGGLGFLLGSLAGSWLLVSIGWINLVIGGFNLLPALPMDGGRILRALLTRKYDFVRATEVSVKVARAIAIILGVIGLATWQWTLILLTVLLWFLGSAEVRMAHVLRDRFTYDENGYRNMYNDVEVFPDGYPVGSHSSTPGPSHRPSAGHPFFHVHRPVRAGGFVIRQRDGRLVIELIQ